MARQYMNIRLSYEAKLYIEEIQGMIQEKMTDKITPNIIDEIEKKVKDYLKPIDPILAGVSITNILKVSTSSIIEEAYYQTQNYTYQEWLKIDELLRKDDFKTDIDVGSLTPKLYLNTDVIEGLQKKQREFMKENMVRPAKMSYVIKKVVYAYYIKLENK
ncbi:hypothetical protein [Aquibacillus rhizosphaerae]|uniref:Uncharacterized protein n=1 Tax=Aquibacillus rhizosphaerae TaxID=3051431 RepID=A0ABT7L828_9BACI|nr:hypothetical protein [Aquibacillus sp. LR5S19]MDL4842007.1 hypothetical protein [Aquibacillus sp. LR5S19]